MSKLGRSQQWIATVLAVLLSIWLLRSFLVPITWAFIIALASWPLYRRFAAHLPQRLGSNVVPLLFTLLITFFVLGPFGFAFFSIAKQAHAWSGEIAAAENHGLAPPDWLTAVPLAGSWLVDEWHAVLGTPGGVTRWLKSADSAWVARSAGSAGEFALHHATIIAFTVLGMFFFYRGGEPLALRTTQFIRERFGQRGETYFQHAARAIRSTMTSMIVVSLIDGVLCGLGYALAGVPTPHVWGAITGLFAIIPFLAYFAIAGAAFVLFAKGAGLAAVLVFCWGVVVVFVADKFVRTALIGSTMRLGFFWVLVGGLGGLETFGLLGLFIGPVILALAGALLRDSLNTEN